ncbi:MAG TPA: ARMT1-like domain-containing protein [Tepidisphaeraceae bacterium]|nr:ARMT1-like domain-containing protein [Tepidisphaeraceae bacterium]
MHLQPFVKLADPARYVACAMDLSVDHDARQHWVRFFRKNFDTILKLGVDAAAARGESREAATDRAKSCRAEFDEIFDAYTASPSAAGRVTMLTIDAWRDDTLRKHGFTDAFIDLKHRENERALPLLPAVCRQIDALRGADQLRAVIEGVFAGNIFDMGSEATAAAYLHGGPDFFATRASLSPRPWLIDDYDALQRRLLNRPIHRKAVFFIDNAGSDFLLGVAPLARWLAMRGTRVVLAANQTPALNDMTIADVNEWWPRIVEIEPSLKSLPIDRVSTGTAEPLIDLTGVSRELNEASADADLVILEGMGRGIESNLDARFSCAALNIAMIKDAMTAKQLGGKLYDVVCRFR